MAVNSAGTVRNRRENIGSQRDKSPEKDNNLVRKRNNKADSPILPDAFKCETYWLTRIVFLRSLSFVYCKYNFYSIMDLFCFSRGYKINEIASFFRTFRLYRFSKTPRSTSVKSIYSLGEYP